MKCFSISKQKRWVFNVLKGEALSLVVSEANRNAYDTDYTEDIQDLFSSGWYERALEDKGEWNATTNTPTLTDNVAANFGNYYEVSVAGTRFSKSFVVGDFILCRDPAGVWSKSKQTDPVWTYLPGDKTGIYKWDAVLGGQNESEAKSDLNKKKKESVFKTKGRNILYGVDYRLGDTVKVQKQAGGWRTTVDKRVVGVRIWQEHNDAGEQPIFEGET